MFVFVIHELGYLTVYPHKIDILTRVGMLTRVLWYIIHSH